MIINPISLGGNGLLPEIIVTAPSGSTLDLMQGSVVLQTYTLSSTETQHTFIVKNTGTYTVRGTSGGDTASVEVVVDAIGQHSCTIEYFNGLKLYWYGDQCEDVTGGWYNVQDATFNQEDIYLPNKNSSNPRVCTNNPVNTANYNKAVFITNTISSTHSNNYSVWVNGTSVRGSNADVTFPLNGYSLENKYYNRYGTGTHTIELDISDINESYFTAQTYYCGGYLYAVWLE